MVPEKLAGKQFETALMDAAARHESEGWLTMSRYGVQALHLSADKIIAVPSLPDFEGVLHNGRQFIIEAKCVQGASFELRDDKFKKRQYSHMAKRAEFGVICLLLLHFAHRTLASRIDPGMTVAVPVSARHPFWMLYEQGERKSLTRDEAQSIGQLVPWRVPKGCRKPLPDLLPLLLAKLGDNILRNNNPNSRSDHE